MIYFIIAAVLIILLLLALGLIAYALRVYRNHQIGPDLTILDEKDDDNGNSN